MHLKDHKSWAFLAQTNHNIKYWFIYGWISYTSFLGSTIPTTLFSLCYNIALNHRSSYPKTCNLHTALKNGRHSNTMTGRYREQRSIVYFKKGRKWVKFHFHIFTRVNTDRIKLHPYWMGDAHKPRISAITCSLYREHG